MSLITKIFGTHSEREIKKIMPLIDKIEALGDKYQEMSDEELTSQTAILKERLNRVKLSTIFFPTPLPSFERHQRESLENVTTKCNLSAVS